MDNLELSSRKRIEEELARVNDRVTAFKREALPEELESGGDNTPLSEEADSTTVVEEKELSYAVLSQLIDRAAALDQALRRLSLGTYGVCISCNGAIPRRRMELVPEVALCEPCQEKEEKLRQAKHETEPRPAQWREVKDFYEKKSEYEE
jgi:DnaK suppressor protein